MAKVGHDCDVREEFVGAKLGAGKTIDAQVSADVDAQVANISAKYRGGAAVNPSIHAGAGPDLSAGGNHNVTTDADLRVDAAVKAALAAAVEGFSCPATMASSPRRSSCSASLASARASATASRLAEKAAPTTLILARRSVPR
ncbi:hypothetical protein BM221_006027 [Beauveria bassiana]|uniref:Uncharacterized protein n=1 Tax=Beauveria bassiana TaxID=176275 RepID=A0A2N6NKT4_BEABA|nr:hypothetical protein BM221_006027 [Beauveria bassiana]